MTWIQNHAEEIEKHTKRLAELESTLGVEEKELDSIRNSLKGASFSFDLMKPKRRDLPTRLKRNKSPWNHGLRRSMRNKPPSH
jgi:uncharacterized coiled-coil protein SlyX